MKEMRPAIFALRVPKAALKMSVAAPQLVAAFLSTTLANLGGDKKNHLFFGFQLLPAPLDSCRDKHEQMGTAVEPRPFGHVQVRKPEGQRGLGAAFFASFFAAKERREPTYNCKARGNLFLFRSKKNAPRRRGVL